MVISYWKLGIFPLLYPRGGGKHFPEFWYWLRDANLPWKGTKSSRLFGSCIASWQQYTGHVSRKTCQKSWYQKRKRRKNKWELKEWMKWMNEWNEWMSEWMSEWMNEMKWNEMKRMNDWIIILSYMLLKFMVPWGKTWTSALTIWLHVFFCGLAEAKTFATEISNQTTSWSMTRFCWKKRGR